MFFVYICIACVFGVAVVVGEFVCLYVIGLACVGMCCFVCECCCCCVRVLLVLMFCLSLCVLRCLVCSRCFRCCGCFAFFFLLVFAYVFGVSLNLLVLSYCVVFVVLVCVVLCCA